jgi:hypothetical protein
VPATTASCSPARCSAGVVPGHAPARAVQRRLDPLDGDSRILFDKATGVISYDRDGDGAIAAIAFAKGHAGLDLTTYDNFFVV